MKDLVTNLILLLYLGVVFIHKLLGYSYLTAAWRSAIFTVALLLLVIAGWYGYHWIVEHNLASQQPEPESVQSSGREQN